MAIMRDDLLDKMVGDWHIMRQFPTRTAENTAKIEWVLGGRWLRIDMKDVSTPAKYEAHVYITRMELDNSYSIHWHDTFGGSLPEVLGTGHRSGDAIVFSWKDADGELRNTFTWNLDEDTWTSRIEQTGNDGEWVVFCTDTFTRTGPG
jgi:hypothetical protein